MCADATTTMIQNPPLRVMTIPPFDKGGDTPLTPLNRGDLNPPLKKGDEGRFSDKIVHVHPTSRWLFKCWQDEYMAEIIGWLIDKGVKVVVTSAPDSKEMEKAKRILSLVGLVGDSPHYPITLIAHYALRITYFRFMR